MRSDHKWSLETHAGRRFNLMAGAQSLGAEELRWCERDAGQTGNKLGFVQKMLFRLK